MRVEPRWLTLEEINESNRAEVRATGEPFQVLDRGALDMARERAYMRWAYGEENDVVRPAAAVVGGIAKLHAFQQANKRTATTCALMFLELNGYRWEREDDEWLGQLTVALVVNEISEDQFAEQIRPFVVLAN